MRIGRSTFYETPDAGARDPTLVAEMKTISDEFEAYGYRRVDADSRPSKLPLLSQKLTQIRRLGL
jgi:putative transposase